MADILVSFNQNRYNSQLGSAQTLAGNFIEPLIAQFNALGVGDIQPEELQSLFSTPVDLVFDKMTGGEPVSIAGLQVVKSKAIEILVKPAGYDAFLQSVDGAKASLKSDPNSSVSILAHQVSTWFQLNEDGSVSVTSDMNETLEKQNKQFARTDAAKTLYQVGQDVATMFNLNNIKGAAEGSGEPDEVIRQMVRYNNYAKQYEINPDGILRANSRTLFSNPELDS